MYTRGAIFTYKTFTVILMICSSVLAQDENLCNESDEKCVIIGNDSEDEVLLQNGDNYTINCKGKVPIVLKKLDEKNIEYRDINIGTSNQTYDDDDYPYRLSLHLYNVDVKDVGFYACFDENLEEYINSMKIPLEEEPVHSSQFKTIYVYVKNGSVLYVPAKAALLARKNGEVVVPCRPTSPDITVKLYNINVNKQDHHSRPLTIYSQYNPKIGFVANNTAELLSCIFSIGNDKENQQKMAFQVFKSVHAPEPKIEMSSYEVLVGDNVTISCYIECQPGLNACDVNISTPITKKLENLQYPPRYDLKKADDPSQDELSRILSINGVTKEDAGYYTCISLVFGDSASASEMLTVRDTQEARLNLTVKKFQTLNQTVSKQARWRIDYDSLPSDVIFNFYKDERLITLGSKYKADVKPNYIIFSVINLTLSDNGVYKIVGENKYVKDKFVELKLNVEGPPTVSAPKEKQVLAGVEASVICDVEGYPLPNVIWTFQPLCDHKTETECTNLFTDVSSQQYKTEISKYQLTSEIKMSSLDSGTLKCHAENSRGSSEASTNLKVYEVFGGFGIINKNKNWFARNDNGSLLCVASKYDYLNNITWYKEGNYGMNETVLETEVITSKFSYIGKLNFEGLRLDDAGSYTCKAWMIQNSVLNDTPNYSKEKTTIFVSDWEKPVLVDTNLGNDFKSVREGFDVEFNCTASGIPRPEIKWMKDDMLLEANNSTEIAALVLNDTTLLSKLTLIEVDPNMEGIYECYVSNKLGVGAVKQTELRLKQRHNKALYLSIIAVIVLAFLVIVMFLLWRIKKEKQLRRELAKAGLLYFNEGATHSLNPDLGIDEQAELLPYDQRFEFPRDKLKLGKKLGEGAFGVVLLGEARGIVDAEETTTVAVKMVKQTAESMYIKALASELKIMVHLGKHLNVVNLLGAVTKNVTKRELLIIVEYCKYGNIHNYMLKHRDVFIDQLHMDGDGKGFGLINKGFSNSGNSAFNSEIGSNHSQATAHTTIDSGITSSRRANDEKSKEEPQVKESEYMQPAWRSNYITEYTDKTQMRPLCTRDLLCWAFQIARGMEYLANRKVLHGDLAARNVLLAEDNVVKIGDFGLARSILKTDNYTKKQDSPLPVKWLALECLGSKIFSTQSDVWSFGVVLWELFSLAQTPYPNVTAEKLYEKLCKGYRLERPKYANRKLHDLMLSCWEVKPSDRPSFTKLQDILGAYLEDTVKEHYIDLNDDYMEMNKRQMEQGQDYLAMVCSPDYRNLVTPVQDYVNSPLLPPNSPTVSANLPTDDEGYLQVSPAINKVIFSPRPKESYAFQFDISKRLSPNSDDIHRNPETAPMLTLDNIPARSSSESDADCSLSPYLPMHPVKAIPEDTEEDSVFVTSDVPNERINNFKLGLNQNAISNPTYITFNDEFKQDRLKPVNGNRYVNLQNGLVR